MISKLLCSTPISPMAAAILAFLSVCGCADDGGRESVYPSIAIVVSDGALSLAAGTLKSANGTYGTGCLERSGSWSLAITAGAPLTHAPLSVVRQNTACVLRLTSLDADEEYVASPSIDMTADYQLSSSSFASAASPLSFYGNACLDALSFATDFVVLILYSDDPNVTTGEGHAVFSVATASAVVSSVPVPDYGIDVSGLLVSVDGDNIVETAVGNAILTDGTVTARDYVIVDVLETTEFVHVDEAYEENTVTAITGANPQISAAALSLVGLDLTVAKFRYIVLANFIDGVPSFEVVTIAFRAPL